MDLATWADLQYMVAHTLKGLTVIRVIKSVQPPPPPPPHIVSCGCSRILGKTTCEQVETEHMDSMAASLY